MTQDLKARIMKWAEFDLEPTPYSGGDIEFEARFHAGELGRGRENTRLQPLIEALADCQKAFTFGEPDYNSAWSMICLMAEGEGSNAEVYQTMAKEIHRRLKPSLDNLEHLLGGGEG